MKFRNFVPDRILVFRSQRNGVRHIPHIGAQRAVTFKYIFLFHIRQVGGIGNAPGFGGKLLRLLRSDGNIIQRRLSHGLGKTLLRRAPAFHFVSHPNHLFHADFRPLPVYCNDSLSFFKSNPDSILKNLSGNSVPLPFLTARQRKSAMAPLFFSGATESHAARQSREKVFRSIPYSPSPLLLLPAPKKQNRKKYAK